MLATFQVENERLLEKVRENGIEVRSFDGWKAEGRWVIKGMRRSAFRVQSGVVRTGINPVTGEDRYESRWVVAYGFTKDQTR